MKSNAFFATLFLQLSFFGCVERNSNQLVVYSSKYEDSALTQIQILPSTFVFDTINLGSTIKGSFTIKNVGKNILLIDSVIKSCSCTSLIITTNKVGISDSLVIPFSVTPTISKQYFVTPILLYLNTKPYYRQILIEGYVK